MSKHTQGPWHTASDATGGLKYIVFDAAGWTVADAKVFHGHHNAGAADANARLIAAAPELLDALQCLANYVGGWDAPDGHPCAIARAAIAKATGEAA